MSKPELGKIDYKELRHRVSLLIGGVAYDSYEAQAAERLIDEGYIDIMVVIPPNEREELG